MISNTPVHLTAEQDVWPTNDLLAVDVAPATGVVVGTTTVLMRRRLDALESPLVILLRSSGELIAASHFVSVKFCVPSFERVTR